MSWRLPFSDPRLHQQIALIDHATGTLPPEEQTRGRLARDKRGSRARDEGERERAQITADQSQPATGSKGRRGGLSGGEDRESGIKDPERIFEDFLCKPIMTT